MREPYTATLELVPAQVLLTCCLEADPVPWSRAGHGRVGQTYTPRRYAEHRNALAWAMRNAYRGKPLAVELGIWATFVRKSRRRVDIDNLLKAVMDAGTAIVWGDDSQLTLALVRVIVDPVWPRTELVIFRREVPEA